MVAVRDTMFQDVSTSDVAIRDDTLATTERLSLGCWDAGLPQCSIDTTEMSNCTFHVSVVTIQIIFRFFDRLVENMC